MLYSHGFRKAQDLANASPEMLTQFPGFNVDMILEAGRRMGRKVEVFSGEFSGLIPAICWGSGRQLAWPMSDCARAERPE